MDKKKIGFFQPSKISNLALVNGGAIAGVEEADANFAREKTAGGSVCVQNNSGSGTHTWSWTSDVKHSDGSITYKGSTAN